MDVYEYLITTHPDLSTFTIEGFDTHSKYENIQIYFNDLSLNSHQNTLVITPEINKIQYVNIVFNEKNTNTTYPKKHMYIP